MLELTGLSADEVSSFENLMAAICPKQQVDDLSQGFELKDYEILITRNNGEKRHVEVSAHRLLIDGQDSDYLIVQALDVTELKRATEELKQANEQLRSSNQNLEGLVRERTQELEDSENRLRMALEGANEGLWVIDFLQSRMHFTTHSAAMLGYSLEELGTTSEKWDTLTHPDDWQKVEKRLLAHFEGKTDFYEAQYRVMAKDGEWKWVLGHGRVMQRDADGKPLRAIGTHVDITRLKEIEFDLRRSEKKFRQLIENAPFGLLFLSLDRTIEYLNPRFNEIFGYSEKEIPNLDTWLKKAYPDLSYRKEVKLIWDKLLDEEELMPDASQSAVFCKDGNYKIVKLTFVSLQQKGWLATYEDVTEIAKAHEALEKREQELATKNASLEEYNTTLKVLLKRREDDRTELEEKVIYNVKDLVLPYVTELEQSKLTDRQKAVLDLLKSNLNEIVSPFSRRLAATHMNLTPKELQVANLLRQGKTSQEIAELICVSESSIVFHRHNIRRKLGLVGEKANLNTYLQSLT
jgi:PAS domain S-box-containing protein